MHREKVIPLLQNGTKKLVTLIKSTFILQISHEIPERGHNVAKYFRKYSVASYNSYNFGGKLHYFLKLFKERPFRSLRNGYVYKNYGNNCLPFFRKWRSFTARKNQKTF